MRDRDVKIYRPTGIYFEIQNLDLNPDRRILLYLWDCMVNFARRFYFQLRLKEKDYCRTSLKVEVPSLWIHLYLDLTQDHNMLYNLKMFGVTLFSNHLISVQLREDHCE